MPGEGTLNVVYRQDRKGNPCCEPFPSKTLNTFTVYAEDADKKEFGITYQTASGKVIRLFFEPDAVLYSLEDEDGLYEKIGALGTAVGNIGERTIFSDD
jgi:hypothetical protein